jgi:hypothetical protein
MRIRIPRLVGVVLVGLLIGWAIFAPLLGYVVGHTDGYVFGLQDVQQVIHHDPPPAIPFFPPPPSHLKVNAPAGDPSDAASSYRALPDGRPVYL